AEQRRKADQRMQRTRRDRKADQRGEDHQRHHPRLHQRDIVADARQAWLGQSQSRPGGHRAADVCAFADERHGLRFAPYLIRGSVSNWWNGGGEDSVHSSVVAPTPHGLLPAARFLMKASAMPKKNTSTPKPAM